ncbi:MAG: DUF1329 domain-containing protein [Candidatus Thiodiazotropha sp.]
MFKQSIIYSALVALSLATGSVSAAVTAEEANRLGNDLTPVGAEKGGNADGTIPAWTGGLTGPLPGWPSATNDRPNPYADDPIQFTITVANMDQYADKLPEIAKAMLKAKPDQFKMNVYPTRRTAAFPEEYYSRTKENAQKAKLINDGNGVENVWGAIPFPIPKNGNDVIWNHLLRYKGVTVEGFSGEDLVYDNGNRLQWNGPNEIHHPFQDPGDDKARAEGTILRFSLTTSEPTRDKGEGTLAIDNIDPVSTPRKAWSYDPGERRVRRAPTLNFDTPDRPITVFDDWDLFNGSPEKYDFKLIGKREMYIPYNNNKINSPVIDREAAFAPGYIDPDLLRYELHRVWVVEANVKQGVRHLYAKRRFYVDEDNWTIMAADKYDGAGNLWRGAFYYPVVASEIPVSTYGVSAHIDLKTNGYYVVNHSAGTKGWVFNVEPRPVSYFTASALRRRGR